MRARVNEIASWLLHFNPQGYRHLKRYPNNRGKYQEQVNACIFNAAALYSCKCKAQIFQHSPGKITYNFNPIHLLQILSIINHRFSC